MSDWEMLDDGSWNGLAKYIRPGMEPDSVDVKTVGLDASPILDDNARARGETLDRRGDMWHAAKIPASVMLEWRVKYGIDFYDPNHREGVIRLLNSSDYRHLKRANIII